MSFGDEVKEVIKTGKLEREKFEQEGRDFEARWYRLRESMAWPLFHEAAQAFKEEQIGAQAELINGSIVLNAIWNPSRGTGHFSYKLTFRSDKEKRVVICSSNVAGINEETFTVDHLTASVVQGKIKQFADLIARGDSPSSQQWGLI